MTQPGIKSNKVWRLFCVLFSVSSAILPLVASAALVPCSGPNCGYCEFLQLGKNIIDFMMYIVFPIVTLMIIYGGFMILTAASSERAKQGRSIITSAITGLLIALLAWLALDTILKLVAPEPSSGGPAVIRGFGPWNQLKCSP